MSTKVTLNLTGSDFLIVCSLFDIDPAEMIENLTGSLSLACYWNIQPSSAQGQQTGHVTDFFMEYVDRIIPKNHPDRLPREDVKETSEKFIEMLTDLPRRFPDQDIRETHGRALVDRWLEEIGEARNKL